MRPTVPLSPTQSAAFAMGRVLILFDVFRTHTDSPLGLDRGMLLDFAAQHPRPLSKTVPELRRVLRAYRLHQGDLSDLFAARHFEVLRERFSGVLSDLLSRGLVDESRSAVGTDKSAFILTATGTEIAAAFATTLSHSYRAIDDVLCEAWYRTSIKDLTWIIREALPHEARQIAELSVPFPTWLSEE